MSSEKAPCLSCGSVKYHYWRKIFSASGNFEVCSDCGTGGTPNLSPDVYFDSSKGAFQVDPNLCRPGGDPIPFSSKREKAAIMRELKLREAGDKEHGSRNFDKRSSQQWKEQGF